MQGERACAPGQEFLVPDASRLSLRKGSIAARTAQWALAALGIVLVAPACTDWQQEGGAAAPYVQSFGPAGLAADTTGTTATVGAASGLVHWDTWSAPDAESGAGQDGAAVLFDTAPLDGAAPGDSAQLADIATETADAEPTEDGGLAADQAGADAAGVKDTTADTATPYTFDGKDDFVGWPELAPPKDLAGAEDAQDAVEPDVSATDVEPADAEPADAGMPDATQADAEQQDGQLTDVATQDAAWLDVGAVDVILPDDTLVDTGSADASGPDSSIDDSGQVDAGIVDAGIVDAGIVDIGIADASASDSADSQDALTLPDGAALPDWQGYGDVPWSGDADVYGGAIGSCLSMYLYQNETCGDSHPTAACIDSILVDGSLYAQFMFDPLRQCEKLACVDLCASATDKKCMEQCIAKYCTPQFFACTSNGAVGTQGCADAWKCAQAYPEKFLTISAKCYAATSPLGQQQFSSVISCVTQPQKTSCVPEIATCFGAGPQGTEGCGTTANCMNACNGDQYCAWSCVGKATPQAVSLLDGVWGCSVQKCTPKCGGAEPCQGDCLKSDCQQELVKCLVN